MLRYITILTGKQYHYIIEQMKKAFEHFLNTQRKHSNPCDDLLGANGDVLLIVKRYIPQSVMQHSNRGSFNALQLGVKTYSLSY